MPFSRDSEKDRGTVESSYPTFSGKALVAKIGHAPTRDVEANSLKLSRLWPNLLLRFLLPAYSIEPLVDSKPPIHP